jgi:hypothetical protein
VPLESLGGPLKGYHSPAPAVGTKSVRPTIREARYSPKNEWFITALENGTTEFWLAILFAGG